MFKEMRPEGVNAPRGEERNIKRNTVVVEIDPENIDYEKLAFCAEVIKQGGLVCFPTETVYGLGANAFDPVAVDAIFEAKGRPHDNPLIVHIDGYGMLDLVAAGREDEMDRLYRLGQKYWPGPLTIIVTRDSAVPDSVSCGLPSVGIRMPESLIARELIRLSGVPIAAPSANLSGRPSPSTAQHVIQDLFGRVDVIISGGDARVGVESTVLDVTGPVPTILRPGAVTLADVESVLGSGDLPDWRIPAAEGEKPKSPGMKYTHYSPDADVTIFDGGTEAVRDRIARETFCLKEGKCGVLTTDGGESFYKEKAKAGTVVLSLGNRDDMLSLTHNLFSRLREFDALGVTAVFAEAVPATGIGNAVMNRLYRAAGGKVISC